MNVNCLWNASSWHAIFEVESSGLPPIFDEGGVRSLDFGKGFENAPGARLETLLEEIHMFFS